MIGEEPLLQERLADLLSWERTKRREKILVEVFFYSVLASLAALPARELVSPWMQPLAWPALLFLLLAPAFFLLRPWGRREWLRALFLLDKTLRLEARAITAWEILGRRERKPGESLVLREAAAGLRNVDPKTLFKRQRSWQEIFALPLLLLWLLFVWFGAGLDSGEAARGSRFPSLAQKLKGFSRDLQDRAKSQGLTETLKVARGLEEAAEKGLKGEISEKKLSEDLAGMVSKIDGILPGAKEADLLFSGVTREGLLDLKAEMEVFKSASSPRGSDSREEKRSAAMLAKIGTLPRLSEEMTKRLQPHEEMGEEELRSLLEKLEKSATAELDRRTLQETEEFLKLLLQGGEGGEKGEAYRLAEQAERGEFSDEERVRGKGAFPGNQPGTKERTPQQTTPSTAGAATQLKGLVGEGQGASMTLRRALPGKESVVRREELLTSYRRQAEEDLASEQIPEGLRETIKRYFLSLGVSESKGGE
ncbi:hypothetical protein EPO44_06945 [bacterium]|nr:MAG: hypothetical protein EPO44_06945 [bacterium]